MAPYYFDATYQEQASLTDGTQVVLRCIRPEDKAMLVEGMEKLSMESRYRRFFMAKHQLTADDLAFLTEVDGVDHFALGAAIQQGEHLCGVGVARFIRVPSQPELGEPAVAIIDEQQGKGLGHLLFMRLISAARERGIQRFHCEVMSGNTSIHHLLDEVPTEHKVSRKGAEETIVFDLPALAPDATDYAASNHESPWPPIVRSLQAGMRLHNELINLFNSEEDGSKTKP